MGRLKSKKKPRTLTCLYCNRTVMISRKGHVLRHKNGSEQCIGTGFIADQMATQINLRKEMMSGTYPKTRLQKCYYCGRTLRVTREGQCAHHLNSGVVCQGSWDSASKMSRDIEFIEMMRNLNRGKKK